MALPAAAHAAVQRATRQTRNRAARAWRGTQPSKAAAGVIVLEAELPDGSAVRLVLTPVEPDRAAVLRQDAAGRWRCQCFTARWSVAKSCVHEQAANARPEAA